MKKKKIQILTLRGAWIYVEKIIDNFSSWEISSSTILISFYPHAKIEREKEINKYV